VQYQGKIGAMTEETLTLRKSLDLDKLIPLLPQAEDINYWRDLNPNSTISDRPFEGFSQFSRIQKKAEIDEYRLQLREEGYFQTPSVIPAATIHQMRDCIENVRKAGFPTMFALVYDVFYQAFGYFNSTLTGILGNGYKLVPNFWVYYIETSDSGKGFEPHRDAEYENTIDSNGMPTVLTIWVTITEANPLNSCMYMVPANRDPEYAEAIRNIKTKATKFALEDIRALPTQAGTLSCWDQYVFHWGSRSSSRAKSPRISYAVYCQRGDIPPVDDVIVDIPSVLDFPTRLSLICRGLYRYSYASLQPSPQAEALLDFLSKHTANLKKT
jgi:hypothetical protein